MQRNPNIAVINIGHIHFAFEDTAAAMQVMGILAQAVQVDDYTYPVRDYTECSHALAHDQSLPSLKFIAASKMNGNETVSEIKERGEREKQDREDLEQGMKVIDGPVAIAFTAPPF